MRDLTKAGLKISGYNCYGEEPQGFDGFPLITVLIGRNNAGKSSLLDAVEITTANEFRLTANKEGVEGRIFLTQPLDEHSIRQVFSDNSSGGEIAGNHFAFGSQWLDKSITLARRHGSNEFVSIEQVSSGQELPVSFRIKLVEQVPNLFKGLNFKKISAERDILPESEGDPSLDEKGIGATKTIQAILTRGEEFNKRLITKEFLSAINSIFGPEIEFSEIDVQKKKTGYIEIRLDEKDKDYIPLGDSGSGIKTVILILLQMLVFPRLENKQLSEYIFAFEELENNLHPGLQRKLLDYITDIVKEKKCHLILTTHSSVVIDYFSNDSDAQILHVSQNRGISSVKTVKSYSDNKGILEDLDFRASDLLMSNGIVWVEGPSDKTFFNKWIEIWTEGKLSEGKHYVCLTYGGKLYANFSGDNENIDESKINLFKINTNAIFIADRDKDDNEKPIAKNKQRILDEVANNGGYAWLTEGREIENYIPFGALQVVFKDAVSLSTPPDKFADLKEYLNSFKPELGNTYESSKAAYAYEIIHNLTKENISTTLDLASRLDKVVRVIAGWNKIQI